MDLRHNELGEEGGRRVARALQPFSIGRLDLRANALEDKGTAAVGELLIAGDALALEQLNLWNNRVSPVGASRLARSLRSNRRLRSLHFGNNSIEDAGMSDLGAALASHPALETLNLRSSCAPRGPLFTPCRITLPAGVPCHVARCTLCHAGTSATRGRPPGSRRCSGARRRCAASLCATTR